MKVYYKIPDSDNDHQNKLVGLLYENLKLRILLAVEPIKKITDKENGIVFIERQEDSIEIRYEGWSYEVELLIKYCLAEMKVRQKIKY